MDKELLLELMDIHIATTEECKSYTEGRLNILELMINLLGVIRADIEELEGEDGS